MKILLKRHLFLTLLLTLLPLPGLVLAASSDALRRQVEILGESSGSSNPYGIRNIADVVELYSEYQYQPLWFAGGPLAQMREGLIEEIAASAGHGLPLSRYHYLQLNGQVLPEAVLDLLYTDALLSQARDRYSGAVDEVDEEWHLLRESLDAAVLVHTLAAGQTDIRLALQALWPEPAEYWALVEKRAALVQEPDVFSARVTPGPLLRPGVSGPRVEQLQDRLLGPGDYSAVFDQRLKQAVIEFQRAAGLEADGIVGDATLEELNANRFSWIERIDANLERWRWLPRQVPATYIRVNIAAYRLRVMQDSAPALDMNVIVGKPFRQTPVFTADMKYLVFLPYWNVPYSIAVKDKLPLLRKDPEPLALAGYEVQVAGTDTFVPVNQVDWSTIRPGHFSLRQLPGEKNALGKVKFMLPNTHNVYLHDTPDKPLFNKTERMFSSGCIRLAEPRKLADWVLAHDKSPYLARLNQLFDEGPTTTAYLNTPIPVYLVYFTAFVDDGRVVFRRDVYERDQNIVNQLKAGDAPSSG